MPRPQKAGIDYFPLDVNFFVDRKIRILKARFGADGITIYIYLLCEIYRAGYYIKIDDDALFIVSDDLCMGPDKVKQVLNFLLERSLFDNTLFQSDKVLTSAGIQRRFQLAIKERAKKNPIEIKGFWLLDEAETEPFIKVNLSFYNSGKNNDNSGKNSSNSRELSLKESKVNKSKENKKISSALQGSPRPEAVYQLVLIDGTNYPVYADDVEKYRGLYPAVDVDQEFRKMIGWLDSHAANRKTQRGIGKFVNGWLCRAQDSARPSVNATESRPTKNQFHNFPQRDTDYDAIAIERARKTFGGDEGNSPEDR